MKRSDELMEAYRRGWREAIRAVRQLDRECTKADATIIEGLAATIEEAAAEFGALWDEGQAGGDRDKMITGATAMKTFLNRLGGIVRSMSFMPADPPALPPGELIELRLH